MSLHSGPEFESGCNGSNDTSTSSESKGTNDFSGNAHFYRISVSGGTPELIS